MRKIRIGINGFGRIGRALARLNLRHDQYDLVAVNDIDPDIDNLAYLFKYDTTYGKLRDHKVEVEDCRLFVNKQPIKVFCESDIAKVKWEENAVDVVIDSSGVLQNVLNARQLVDSGRVKKVVVTHAPNQGLDFTYMEGVNEREYNKNRHHVISTSICDANAVSPFFKLIDDAFGVEMGEVTTLHPWLSYQNLVDGTIKSVSSPGHYWKDYALGRSSIGSLIPKDTTLCNAMENVVPGVSDCVHSASFRTPTSIVSGADGVFLLKDKTSLDAVHSAINAYVDKYPGVLIPDNRSLVSIDYLGRECGAVIDTRWLNLNMGRMLKFVLWYDNEWGYASRAYNLIKHL